MTLLNPIWLFALAALSIPVVIHLWNIRRGKTLKVGSIALVTISSQKTSRSLKLHNLPLLLLRCLLLALLAIVLAMPFLQKQVSSSTSKGWVLIPSENLKESYQKFKPRIDSLTKVGYEFHYFNKGFQKADLSALMAAGANSTPKTDTTKATSYWGLAEQLNDQAPVGLPVYLFTPNNITHFTGDRPEVSLKLHWQTYAPADSVSTWIEKAWLSNDNDIQVTVGNSRPNGTSFTNYTIQQGDRHNSSFIVNADNGRLTVGLKNSNHSVEVDTATWRFAIAAGKNTADARYLQAALASIIQFSKHKAIIKEYNDAAQITSHYNWLFWLSDKAVNSSLDVDNLFTYADGKVKDISSWISNTTSKQIPLYKLVSTANEKVKPVWQDGSGNPVLGLQQDGKLKRYQFYSRFDPAWSELIWSDAFPKMMLKLIAGTETTGDPKNERRIMDADQLLPVINKEPHTLVGKITEHTDLSRYCWLLLVLTFAAERWLAHKQRSGGKQILQHG